MLNIGPQELLVVLLIALLIVGPQRLPELGRTVGRGLRELRRAQDEVRRSLNEGLDGTTGDVLGPLRDTAREIRGTAGTMNRAARSADPRRVTRPLHRPAVTATPGVPDHDPPPTPTGPSEGGEPTVTGGDGSADPAAHPQAPSREG